MGKHLYNWVYIDSLVQDCSNSIANALELLQSCPKPSICGWQSNTSVISSLRRRWYFGHCDKWLPGRFTLYMVSIKGPVVCRLYCRKGVYHLIICNTSMLNLFQKNINMYFHFLSFTISEIVLQSLTSQDVSVPGPSFRILDSTWCHHTPLCHI